MPDEPKGIDRRALLKLGAAAGALAGCSPPAGPQKLIPYLVPPEEIVPGTPVFYRTVCRECSAGCGVTARTREGRVVKLEGNPDDPIGAGALCARGQAALQALYAPERFRGPMRRGGDGRLAGVSWDEAEASLADALAAARARNPNGVRMLTRPEPGAAGAVQREFMAKLGCHPEQRVVLEPFDHAALREAGRLLFGRAELPAFDLAQARTVVSFGADFVETWLSPVELARQLASGRGRVGPERTRLVWIAPRLCLTGVGADRWLSVRAGGEPWAALALLRFLCDPASAVAGLAPESAAIFGVLERFDLAEAERRSGLPGEAIAGLGRELAGRRPSAVLGPGMLSCGPHATRLAVAIQLVNWVLGNVGKTVLYGLDPLEDPPSPPSAVRSLLADMAAGRVEVLLVHHADPVGVLPAALGAAAALARVPLVASFADLPDATGERARLVLPDNHPLESFGDVTPRRGVVGLAQPAMTPLAETRSSAQVLIEVAAKLPAPAGPLPYDDFESAVQSRRAKLFPSLSGDALAAAGRAAQQRGLHVESTAPAAVSLRAPDPGLLALGPAEPPPPGDDLELVVFPTALRGDGRGASLPWLREVPDVLTSVSWTAWAELAPATARRLGIADGDVVAVTTPAGRVTLPACAFEGLREDAVGVPLGPEALALLPAAADGRSGAVAWRSVRARVEKTARRIALPRLTATPYEEGRTIVRTVSSAAPTVAALPPTGRMVPLPKFPQHRWAMAIDTDRCTGCQACVVACYAENNVPVVGPEAMTRGRNMAWLRIEHFVSVEPNGARVDLLPMLCQQCGNAPCETVCPVYATYTTPEGLNAQAYNRCVGTRYCSNNCPYKVRVFNWRDPEFQKPLNMQLNPDVTVRSKGVMEKCTFCVQRIRFGENAARDERRPVRDGDIVPACAQTCPAQAIVFGDADDPHSRVAALQREPRGYSVLGELDTLPAITYLARVREEEA